MFGFQQCCDANRYLDLGARCLNNWDLCWHGHRPMGSIILNALMPYGLAPLNHVLLLFFSLHLIAGESGIKLDSKYPKFWSGMSMPKVMGAFILLEFMFIGLASVNLTDISAGIFAAFAILGFARKKPFLLALAGGASVLIRAAYLYPILILVIIFLVESLYAKRKQGLYAGLFFVCLLPQFLLTYQHIGVFAYLNPASVKGWQEFHFSSNWYGYDTLASSAGVAWQDPSMLDLTTAYRQQQWFEVLRLFSARTGFYFSSFAPWGKAYLTSPVERFFSLWVLAGHLAALVLSTLYLLRRGILWRIGLPLSLILAQGVLIIPEQRFVFVIQLFLVMFSYLYFCELAGQRSAPIIKSGAV